MSAIIPFPDKFPPRAERAVAPPERSEMLAALIGSLAVMSGSTDPIGKAYREKLCARIRSIRDRELGSR